ncbi:MAG: YbhB/YbcL family Raf kinase inhibitor-like protein [Bdellovibrionota bacterium]
MQLTSSAFQSNQKIPQRFSGEGDDVSPPLEWSDIPKGCKSFALICEDPDAAGRAGKKPPFAHWLIYNISGEVTSLPEGLPAKTLLDFPVSASQGTNSFGKVGYNGPMPPAGHGSHHYRFVLHALDMELDLDSGLTREEVLKRIEGHVLAKAGFTGTYERKAHEKKKSA